MSIKSPAERSAFRRPAVLRAVSVCLVECCLALAAGDALPKATVQNSLSVADDRIRYYEDRVAQHPRSFPLHAQLAEAYLRKARLNHDPACLAKARAAIKRSLEIQPNFTAFQVMAAVCNFSHRFEEGLGWLKQAKEASRDDTSITAMTVESLMGLGRYEDARKLLPSTNAPPGDYHTAAALGSWLTSQNRYDEAREAFQKAAEFARHGWERSLEVWAEVNSAGTLLDSGRPKEARSYLDAAARLDSDDTNLQLHRAEFMQMEGRLSDAAAIYKSLLKRQPDPEIERKAYLLARSRGKRTEARRHFEAAEKGFQSVLDAGEIYTLGSLAQLYCDAGVQLNRAQSLAEQNLEYKRDTEARKTLACAQDKLGKSAKNK